MMVCGCALKAPLAWFLVLTLLLGQTLGLMHGTVHGPVYGTAVHTAARDARLSIKGKQPASPVAASRPKTNSRLLSLFSSHTSGADCLLYDQVSHGGAALHVTALSLPVLLPSFAVSIFAGDALARWAALFDARGPPRTR